MQSKTGKWFVWCAFVALGLSISACAGEENGGEPESVALSEDVPYLQNQMLFAHANTAPGAAIYNGKAYFSYIRTDSRIGIVIESNLGLFTGQNATVYALPDTSNYGADLVAFDGFLDLFYVGQNGNLYMRRSSDGVNWAGPWALDTEGFWLYTPSAVALDNNSISVFAVGNTISGHILFQVNVSNTTVSNIYFTGTGTGVTNNSPAATIWNGQVYLTWAGTDSNKTIFIQHTPSLTLPAWSSKTATADGGLPSLFPFSGQMELVFRGNDSSIYRAYTTDGVSFRAATPDTMSFTNQQIIPFLAVGTGGISWAYYIGTNNGLYTAIE